MPGARTMALDPKSHRAVHRVGAHGAAAGRHAGPDGPPSSAAHPRVVHAARARALSNRATRLRDRRSLSSSLARLRVRSSYSRRSSLLTVRRARRRLPPPRASGELKGRVWTRRATRRSPAPRSTCRCRRAPHRCARRPPARRHLSRAGTASRGATASASARSASRRASSERWLIGARRDREWTSVTSCSRPVAVEIERVVVKESAARRPARARPEHLRREGHADDPRRQRARRAAQRAVGRRGHRQHRQPARQLGRHRPDQRPPEPDEAGAARQLPRAAAGRHGRQGRGHSESFGARRSRRASPASSTSCWQGRPTPARAAASRWAPARRARRRRRQPRLSARPVSLLRQLRFSARQTARATTRSTARISFATPLDLPGRDGAADADPARPHAHRQRVFKPSEHDELSTGPHVQHAERRPRRTASLPRLDASRALTGMSRPSDGRQNHEYELRVDAGVQARVRGQGARFSSELKYTHDGEGGPNTSPSTRYAWTGSAAGRRLETQHAVGAADRGYAQGRLRAADPQRASRRDGIQGLAAAIPRHAGRDGLRHDRAASSARTRAASATSPTAKTSTPATGCSSRTPEVLSAGGVRGERATTCSTSTTRERRTATTTTASSRAPRLVQRRRDAPGQAELLHAHPPADDTDLLDPTVHARIRSTSPAAIRSSGRSTSVPSSWAFSAARTA